MVGGLAGVAAPGCWHLRGPRAARVRGTLGLDGQGSGCAAWVLRVRVRWCVGVWRGHVANDAVEPLHVLFHARLAVQLHGPFKVPQCCGAAVDGQGLGVHVLGGRFAKQRPADGLVQLGAGLVVGVVAFGQHVHFGQDHGGVNTGEHGINANVGAPYGISLTPFLSPIGVPCQQPPWGFVAAASLQNGKIYYQRKNGTIRNMNPLGLAIKMGVPGIGGPMITGSGVVFMAAAVDNNFRAYDLDSGDVLWNVEIPAGGQATPMTYLNSQGEQMVVLVAGGHGSVGTTLGDYVLAYKLEAQ